MKELSTTVLKVVLFGCVIGFLFLLVSCGERSKQELEQGLSTEAPLSPPPEEMVPTAAKYDESNSPFVTRDTFTVTTSPVLGDAGGQFAVKNLIDGTYLSWTGESVTFTAANNALPVVGVALKNGHGDIDFYGLYGRVKSFEIYIDGAYRETIEIRDSFDFEQYAFEKPVEVETVQFVIGSVYPGTESGGACIAEILLVEQLVEEDLFYRNALLWAGNETKGWYDENFVFVNKSNISTMFPTSRVLEDTF